MSINILSLHKLQEKHIAMIKEVVPDAVVNIAKASEASPYLPEADILIAFGQTDLAPLLPAAPNLKWIHALTAGVDKFLAIDNFRQSDIILTNSKGIHGIPIAEHVLGMMLSFSRCLFTAYNNQKAHKWQALKGIDELFEKTAAVIGLGSVGHEVAKHLKNMGMNVIAVKETLTPEPFVNTLYQASDLDKALFQADFVIVTLPLTPQTRNLFTLDKFKLMKPSAIFINVARGEIVNEADLINALENHIIAGAALDVFDQEPLPEDSPLWDVPNLFISPHHSSSSPYYISRTMRIFAENLRRFPAADSMLNVVDKIRGY